MKRLFALILALLVCLTIGAFAQAPNELNAGSQVAYSGSSGAYTLSWWGVAGNTYLIETSDDLENWAYLPIVESGSNSAIQWGFTSTSSNLFLKLEYISVPITQLSGAMFNGPTDPSSGLPGDWELFYYGTLGVDPSALVSWSGTITNLQAYQQGLNPLFGISLTASLPSGATNAALVWADHTTGTETGYQILRESGTSGFQSIGFVGTGGTSYNDYAIQGSTTYIYQIEALNGSEQSALSNRASVTTLVDSNGDGIADIYKPLYGINPGDGTDSAGGSGLPDGWLIEYGLNPLTTTNADVDLIGKGWTLAQDYAAGTNPNLVDTDGDGVPDCIDKYPLDPRRSHDVSTPPIAVLDLSAGTATGGVTQVAMDDNGNAAFGFVSGTDSNGNATSYSSYLWQSGTAALAQTISLEVSGSWRTVTSMDGSGAIYGMDGANEWNPPFQATGGNVGDINAPSPPYDWTQYATDGGLVPLHPPWVALRGNANDGTYFGGFYGFVSSGTSPFLSGLGGDLTNQGIVCNGNLVVFDPRFSVDTGVDIPSNMQVIPANFVISAVSGSGAAIGNVSNNFFNYYSGPTYWDGQQLDPLPGPAINLNNAGMVIGTIGTSGTYYLWQNNPSGTGTTTLLQNLIPPIYQKQIGNISAAIISNPNAADNDAIHIILSADNLEGPGSGSWVNETFDLKFYPPSISGSTPTNTLTCIQAPDGFDINYQQANFDGDFLSTGYDPNTSPLLEALQTFKIDFIPSDSTEGQPYVNAEQQSTAMVERGYDPPQPDDDLYVNGIAYPQDQTPSGKLKPEWWVSVGGTGSLSTCQKVKIEFPSVADAEGCRLVVTSGSSNVTVTPTTFTSKETVLTITGNNTTQTNVPATAQVFSLSGTASMATLHIDVLPVRNVSLGIYYVSDTNSSGTALPAEIPNATAIQNELNTIYEQACITFTISASGTVPIHYDLDTTGTSYTPNGYLDSDSASNSEFQALDSSTALDGGKLNVVILGKLQHTYVGSGDGVLGEYTDGAGYSANKAYIYAQTMAGGMSILQNDAQFYHVIAHEIGHALNLSTRFTPNYDSGIHHHDPGPFPEGPRNALMYPDAGSITASGVPDNSPYHWMRHEDWRAANVAAAAYQ